MITTHTAYNIQHTTYNIFVQFNPHMPLPIRVRVLPPQPQPPPPPINYIHTNTHTGITLPPHQLLLLPRTPLLIRDQLRLQAKLTYIPPLLLEVLAELQVLSDDRVLADMRDEEYRQERAEQAQRAADPEWRLVAGDCGRAARGADDFREHPGAHECADLVVIVC